MTFKDVMEGYQKTVEAYLQTLFAEDAPQKQLFDAMRYSLLAGGKRIRPILVLEFCRICGGETEKALPFAAAFGQLARAELPAERIGKAVALLSQRAGECGMVGGQVLDLAGEQLVLTEEEIYNVHRLKTGALISAACQLGVIAAGGTQEQLDAADRYAEALGLAFQTRDDMLDVLGDAGKMGKATGMDENKNTFVRLYGVGACSRLIEKETQKSIEALGVFEDSEFLKELSMKLAIREC